MMHELSVRINLQSIIISMLDAAMINSAPIAKICIVLS